MRAVVMREFGPPEVLEPAEVAEVRAGPDKVIIDVEFANVTFVETQVRAGRPPHPSMLPALPAILGNGVGGTIAEAGPETSGAGTGAGRRVVASLNGTGGYAERVVAPAARLIEVPDELAMRDAVALLADGRTALALAGRAGLRKGDTVLIEAAAGGVGTLLVQIARNAGARVVALAGQPRKLAIARDLGADLAVDYSRDGWEQEVRGGGGEVDVVFDGVGGDIGLAAFGLLGAGRPVLPVRHGQRALRLGHARTRPGSPGRRSARRGREPRGTGGAGPHGAGRGRGGPPAAGHRPGIRAGRGRGRARGDRGPGDHRQDAADRAAVTGQDRWPRVVSPDRPGPVSSRLSRQSATSLLIRYL